MSDLPRHLVWSTKSLLPTSLAAITPAFITSILQTSGLLRQATVTAVRAAPLVARAGYNAQLARLHLVYDLQEKDAPRSLIAKLPTADSTLHENAALFRPGAKECWFYRYAASRAPVGLPCCYYGELDTATGESVLLLEDLAPARVVDWATGASVAEADLALQAIARLHAAWWGVEPDDEPELTRLLDNVDQARGLVDRLYAQDWPNFLAYTVVEVPDDVRRLGDRLVGRVAAAEALLDDAPRTLVHGDYRLGNVLYGERDGRPICWVIDWEDVGLSSPLLDVAWFLGACLRVQDSSQEHDLLQRYHQALLCEGVAGYPWSSCLRDYSRAMLACFVQGILSAVPPETEDSYAHDLACALGERFVRVAQRLRLGEWLP